MLILDVLQEHYAHKQKLIAWPQSLNHQIPLAAHICLDVSLMEKIIALKEIAQHILELKLNAEP